MSGLKWRRYLTNVSLLPAAALLALVATQPRAATITVTNQAQFNTAVVTATQPGHSDTIDATVAGTIDAGTSLTLPGAATSINLQFGSLGIGDTVGDGTLTLGATATVSFGQPDGNGIGLNLGDGHAGTLNINGALLTFNILSQGEVFNIGADGGTGIVNMTGGAVTFDDSSAASGVYGALVIAYPFVGSVNPTNGTFNQSGGTVSVSAGALDIGIYYAGDATGTYNLTNSAVLQLAAGTAYIGQGLGGIGALNVSGNATFDFESIGNGGQLYVGDNLGIGTITQNGANSTVILNVANIAQFGSNASNSPGGGGTGTYNLLAGSLQIGGLGAAFGMDQGGVGILNQSGGVLVASAPVLIGSSGTGTYNLSAGTANFGAGLTIAKYEGSVGTVNQTGGVATITGGNLGVGLAGTGTYNLNGGLLQVGGTNGIVGSGPLNLGGGTLKVIGSALTTANPIGLTGTNSTIDTNGLGATFSGVMSGTGGFAKSGLGTLSLTAANTYSGGTTVNGGTLMVNADAALGAPSSGLTVNGATLEFGAGFSFSANRAVSLGAGGGTVDTNGFNATIPQGITGTGGLTLADSSGTPGTLTLGGANSYSGGTTISAGTLMLGAGASLASGSTLTINGGTFDLNGNNQTVGTFSGAGGAVALGSGILTVNQTASTSYAGAISGAGGLALAGSGALTLSGTSTFTGGTIVKDGTLIVTNGAALGGDSVTVQVGSTIAIVGTVLSNPLSLTGSGMGGAGALTGTGRAGSTGTITLTGNTTIGVANAGDTLTLSGMALGDGGGGYGLTKTGAGTLALFGPVVSYTGATTIAQGVLALGGVSSLATSSGVSLAGSGATLDISGPGGPVSGGPQRISGLTGVAGSVVALGSQTLTVMLAGGSNTFAGVIKDGGIGGGVGGNLVLGGGGTLVLTGNNTYSGTTTIAAGTLQIGSGGTSGAIVGASMSVANGAALAFDRSDLLTYGGTISGAGNLIQQGASTSTLILNGGSGAFTGLTTVASGTLEVGDANHGGAALGGNVSVSNGGALMGHGTIGGNLGNSGIVQPGGTIGVLTVAGNYTQAGSGTLIIEITPNAAAGPGVGYSQLRVGGTANLAGALSILQDPGAYTVGSRYTVLTAAGGRIGTFGSVTATPLFAGYIAPVVSYDPNDVYLTLDLTPGAFNGGQEVPDALTAMVNAAKGVGDTILADVCGAQARRSVTPGEGCEVHPLAAGYHSEVWMRGLGGLGSVTGGGRMSFRDSYGGMLIGAGIGRDGLTIGLGGGFLATALRFSDGSSASQNAGVGFVYGRYEQGPWRLGAVADYAGGQVEGSRALPGTGLTATGNRPGAFAGVQTRVAYDLAVGAVTIEPAASLGYIHAGQAGFTESGASLLDLAYSHTATDTVEGRLTVRAAQQFVAGGWGLEPWVEAGVQETFSGLSRGVVATDGSVSSSIAGVSPAPTAGVIGVGLNAGATAALSLFIRYQGHFSANQIENAFSAGLSVRF